jgi:hypothetical protein
MTRAKKAETITGELEQPTRGGSYQRREDGTLELIEATDLDTPADVSLTEADIDTDTSQPSGGDNGTNGDNGNG